MCQQAVFQQLLILRQTGNDSFLSMTEIEKEICKKIENNPKAVRRKVNKLYAHGFLDIQIPKGKGSMYWRRRFRVKDIYKNQKII